MSTRTHDPALYRELSAPFESVEEFDESLAKFRAEVAEARVRAGLPDVYVIMCGSVLPADGQEQRYITAVHFGDALLAEGLTAWAYGKEHVEHREMIARTIAAKKREA